MNLCKMIVMNHYINTVMFSDEERGKRQGDGTYKNKLVNDVINMYSIEKLAISDFSNSSLEAFMPSAAQEESMRKLTEMLGYNMKYYQSATTEVQISYAKSDSAPISNQICIDKFTNIKDIDATIWNHCSFPTWHLICLSNSSHHPM